MIKTLPTRPPHVFSKRPFHGLKTRATIAATGIVVLWLGAIRWNLVAVILSDVWWSTAPTLGWSIDKSITHFQGNPGKARLPAGPWTGVHTKQEGDHHVG